MFVELDESISRNISFSDEFISNVYYVPNMKINILSLGQLRKGYDIHVNDLSLSIKDGRNNLIAKVPMSKNRMFLLNIQNDVSKCLKAYYDDALWLWTFQFGHLNFGSLSVMSKHNMVRGLPSINHLDQLCEGYLLGKKFRASFPKESSSRVKKLLKLIHVDIYGPIKPSSLGKKNYFLFLIDDFSRKTLVYFLKQNQKSLPPSRSSKL